MTKQISDYTVDELSKKIEAIKAERERTANALKRYEEELERRKQEVPLGVPCEGPLHLSSYNTVEACCFRPQSLEYNRFNSFSSKESAEKHAEMLLDWRKALVAITKGEPIDIKVLLPLLKKGWVAMDKNGNWHWYMEKPYIEKFYFSWNSGSPVSFIGGFKIKPAEDWETSLQECGLCTC